MREKLVSLNTKISREEKEMFLETVKAVGFTPSAAIKMFVRKFIEYGGFPFEVRREPRINYNNPNLLRAHLNEKGVLIVPSAWRDEEDK